MTDEEHQLLLLRGTIASLPAEQQLRITTLGSKLRAVVEEDEDFGPIALALVGAEMAAKP